MAYVAIVIIITLIEYTVFSILVGRARARYKCPAPAITGDPIFERYYRVHQNTMESLVIFIPAMVLYAYFSDPVIAAAVGLVFPISRVVYLKTYVANPDRRAWGFVPGFFAILYLLLGGLFAAVDSLY